MFKIPRFRKILGAGVAGLALLVNSPVAMADTAEEINNLAQMQAQYEAQQRQFQHDREMQRQQQEFQERLLREQQKANEKSRNQNSGDEFFNEKDEPLIFACYNSMDANGNGLIDTDDLREVPGKGTVNFKVGQEICFMSRYLRKWARMTSHLTMYKGNGDIEWQTDYKIKSREPGCYDLSNTRWTSNISGVYVLERKIIETGRKDFLMVKIEK